jgi:hypothetical protein
MDETTPKTVKETYAEYKKLDKAIKLLDRSQTKYENGKQYCTPEFSALCKRCAHLRGKLVYTIAMFSQSDSEYDMLYDAIVMNMNREELASLYHKKYQYVCDRLSAYYHQPILDVPEK